MNDKSFLVNPQLVSPLSSACPTTTIWPCTAISPRMPRIPTTKIEVPRPPCKPFLRMNLPSYSKRMLLIPKQRQPLFLSSETAFMTHHDPLPPRAAADSREDPRPNYRKAVPQDSRNGMRPECRPLSSWDRPRQDPPPDRVHCSLPDRPASSTPRRNDDDSIFETECLQ
jgi:hypothetical protein